MVLAGLVLALITPSAEAQSRRWVPVPGKSVVAFEATHRLGDFRGSSDTGVLKMSCDSRATSASIPGAIVPFCRSASSAAAEPRV